MKMKIIKEIKFSDDEWNKVLRRSAKKGMLPASYIRDQAVNGKIMVADISVGNSELFNSESRLYWDINRIAKEVNTIKNVTEENVRGIEACMDFLEDIVTNKLRPFAFREAENTWRWSNMFRQ